MALVRQADAALVRLVGSPLRVADVLLLLHTYADQAGAERFGQVERGRDVAQAVRAFGAVFGHGTVGGNHRNGQPVRGDSSPHVFRRARLAVDADDGGAHAEGVIAGAGGESGQLIEGDCAHPFVAKTFSDAYRE